MAAVSRRFTSSEITAALAFLQQQGLVNSSGVKRPLMLSKLFAEHLEVQAADLFSLVTQAGLTEGASSDTRHRHQQRSTQCSMVLRRVDCKESLRDQGGSHSVAAYVLRSSLGACVETDTDSLAVPGVLTVLEMILRCLLALHVVSSTLDITLTGLQSL